MTHESPLALDAETMRALGYRVVDLLLEVMSTPTPVVGRASAGEMRARIAAAAPEAGESFDAILGDLVRDVLPYRARCDDPAYFAFIPGSSTWPGALADLVASALNLDTCWWLGAAGPSQVELVVLDWFRDWLGYPAGASGVLLSGGSAANMTALACARETLAGPMRADLIAYMSDQTHSSMARAARVLGFRADQVRVLPVDEQMRLRPDALAAAIQADVSAGRRPLFLCANAGTTNSGSVDPLEEVAGICRDHGVWMHVDGSYGAFACLTERGRSVLRGIERADSIALDPHKWLFQPFECGALLVRDGGDLRRAFEITPDYLKDMEVGAQEVNFSDRGVQLTRAFRALKVWMSVRYFGVAAFRAAIDRALELAQRAQARIESSPELELLCPAALGVVAFRRRPLHVDAEAALESLNADLVARLERESDAFVSSTRLKGRYAVRLCILNYTSSADDVDRVLDFFERAPVAVAEPGPVRAKPQRDPVVLDGWLGRARLDAEALQALPLFAGIPDGTAGRVLLLARERRVAAGDPVVAQWEASRDFYVLLEGEVVVMSDDVERDRMGPGEFFGELAALDWGASFGRVRQDAVVALQPSRLLVLPPDALAAIMRETPLVRERVTTAAQSRMR